MGATKEDLSKSKSASENTSPLQKKVPGPLSRLFFTWMLPLFYIGTKRDLEESDLVPPKSLYDSKVVGNLLERKWIEEETAARLANRKPSFKKVLYRTFFWSYLPGGLMQFAYVFARTGAPLLFAELLTYWSAERAISQTTAAYYAASMIAIYWAAALCNHHGDIYCKQFGMKMRIATSTLMFRKIMRMDNGSLGDTTAGKVVNLLSNDLQRFDLAFLFLHYVWIIPLQIIAVCYLGYLQAGYAALIGFAALIIMALPIQGGLGRLIGKARGRVAKTTDERIKVMSEVISGIQVIKMYAWEIPFEKVVGEKRAAEIKEVRFTTLLRAIFIGFMVFTDKTVLFLTILTLVLSGNSMSATVIYPIQQFISAAQVNITLILPLVLSFTAELFVSLKRIEEFLHKADRPDLKLSPESMSHKLFRDNTKMLTFDDDVKSISYRTSKSPSLGQNNKGFKHDEKQFLRTQSFTGDVAVEVRDVSCSWIGDPNVLALKNISLRVRSGKLCAVIGAVGSGKSSFLQMLLKELPVASGNFSVYGKISYACQEAWLFPSTVRENILFGLPFDPEKYKKVCKACALEKDFKQFPFGDQSLVGERGTSLSGGQRARINLARAVYREADVYLLDDPLSAVDANVGRQLFEGCINGYLRNKTRILVTHQIHFLRAADQIVVLNKASVENMGTFEELITSEKEFATLLASLQDGKDKDSESMASTGSDSNRKELARSISRTISITEDDEPQHEAQKMAAEERQSGNLKFEVVMAYFKTGGGFISMITLFIILCSTVAGAGADYWVSYWTNEIELAQANNNGTQIESGLDVVVGKFTTGQYLLIQGGIVGVCILLVQIRSFPFTTLCMNASRRLHNQMFANMLRGVMRFFDTSSSGRILNRFTKDMGAIDEMLPRSLLDVLQIFSNLFFVIILNAIALYWTLIPSSVLFVIFTLFIMVYLRTAQAVKRLEGTTKSPVFGMVTSALNGISTIRACGAEQKLIQQFDEHQDLHTAAWNDYLGGGSAFGFYLDTLCLVYLASVIFVFIYIDFGDLIAVGTVGLAVTQSNGLTAILQHGARMLVEYIAQLTSVERVLEYTKIPTEDHLFHGSEPTPALWPTQGEIVFKNVYLRYAPEEAHVLKNLNIHIESGWKVGIVGRTGAGKSSLISAMFRFANLEGTITIDGVDTALLAKQELRQKISIIPQEPVLFSATIRYNLDPFGIYSDEDLWRALEQVDMKKAVPSLDLKVTEGGSNFSVGQRQLMCLARAVLRSNKILIMDEATANVDPQTDNFIQQTIRRQFATCTVLTIAHRLNTIMDSDRVLVMDSGEVAEFDHPYLLLSDSNSHFSSMVRETGDKMANTLLEVARQAYYQNNLKDAR